MISIYKIKPKFQAMLLPVLRRLNQWGITANQITVSAILLSLGIGFAFWFADKTHWLFLILPLGLLLRMALNALDGMMARTYQQQSKKGEILNELGDVVSDIFVFFPLLKFEIMNWYLVLTFMFLSVLNEFAGVLAKVVSGTRRYDGPMGKSDRAFVISIYGVLQSFHLNLNHYMFWVLIVLNIFLFLSTFLRIKNALK